MKPMPKNLTAEEKAAQERRAERSNWPVRKGRLKDLETGDETDVSAYTTVEQRFEMMWQLAQNMWAFRGEKIDESSFPRTVGRLIRRGS
jgi:hypothetical protein